MAGASLEGTEMSVITETERRPETMTVDEVAAYTGLHRLTLYEMCRRYLYRADQRLEVGLGPIPDDEVRDNEIVCSKWGRRIVIRRDFVDAKLAGQIGVRRAPEDGT